MNYFKSQEEISLVNVTTWGLEEDKYGGYKLPLLMEDFEEEVEKIEKLVEEHGAKNPLYGECKTLYLKIKNLSQKQRDELLDKGRKKVHVVFKVLGVVKNDKGTFLVFRVTGLKRLEKVEEPPSDLE